MKIGKYGDRDPLLRLQKRTQELLETEIRRWRDVQKHRAAKGMPPEESTSGTIAMLARTAACFLAEARKGGKDTRDSGRKMSATERRAAIAAYLRQIPESERAEVLAEARADVLE